LKQVDHRGPERLPPAPDRKKSAESKEDGKVITKLCPFTSGRILGLISAKQGDAMSMADLTRRRFIKNGTVSAAAAAFTGPAFLDWAAAWAQTAPWKPEQGARLSLLRWKYFIQEEDEAFVAAVDAFTRATGVKVGIIRESTDDIQPKASVAAHVGAGPDLFWRPPGL